VTDFATTGLLWLLTGVALIGAVTVVFVREVLRMALGLGAFLLALAGLFAYFGFGFLALAELFVYVGGVLILILFAIMLVHRTGEGRTQLALRDPIVPAVAAGLVCGLLFSMLRSVAPELGAVASPGGPTDLSRLFLGSMLPQFEIAGALLLVALVVVVLVSGGEHE